ncbi:TlyA family RNA methyltransferase [Dissulfurirhabdus thermomarina]|uniref:TlyA family RNA methyltransferase n=1 Tax=Dissulfurirhabdus thermomarina TaxID=1765737 RepID=A0A6N9TP80_DISTH|nr:TlyA family RNA methyltransferase [Dissulfurirhabdus thermomarina]NDY42240.1 TlyA family RNA methyltransferase [Dissulfurirhabdus thermomarina]NMX23166.1 TlyA family RNA methyltransferase [Dissulfurirhabdus thermomarina]
MTSPSTKPHRVRLDARLVSLGLAPSRQRAQALIGAGKVRVDGRPVDKAGRLVPLAARVEVAGPDHPFVSRGGLKLAHALDTFGIEVRGLSCLDVGASTGGFTDCLLQRGARHVIAVDVGYGQLAWRLRQSPRVTVLERTNIRHLAPGALGQPVDLAVVDTSFISLRLVIPAVLPHLGPGGRIVALVKPQFEVGRAHVGKGGVVRDEAALAATLEDLVRFFNRSLSLSVRGPVPSPIRGAKGNREFLVALAPPEATAGAALEGGGEETYRSS